MLAHSSIFLRLGTNWFPSLDAALVPAKLAQASLKNFTSHILKDIFANTSDKSFRFSRYLQRFCPCLFLIKEGKKKELPFVLTKS